MIRKELAAADEAAAEAAAAASKSGGGCVAAAVAAAASSSSSSTTSAAQARLAAASDEVIYKIDIPANRYDMLCLEGIARALNIFTGRLSPPPRYLVAGAASSSSSKVSISVKPEVVLIRPFIVAAVLRGVSLDPVRYASLIDLQERLHQNLCRHRALVASGTHDLSKLRPPFTYEALHPREVEFLPLKQERPFRADELLDHYAKNDLKLRKFVPLLKDSAVVPVVLDSERRVASMPPVINGALSAITLDTRDILVECTGTDSRKCGIVLNTVVAAFAEYCSGSTASTFSVEGVEIVSALGEKTMTPDLSLRSMRVSLEEIHRVTGLKQLGGEEVARLLTRMALEAKVAVENGKNEKTSSSSSSYSTPSSSSSSSSSPSSNCSPTFLDISIPPTRTDVLHACDVAEDVAIAFGYNNIEPSVPALPCFGRDAPLSALCEALRIELAAAGLSEILTWALCPAAEAGRLLRRPAPAAVAVADAATAEFEVLRTSLLPGALRTLASNRDAQLPVRVFEVGDVVLLDGAPDGLEGGRWGDFLDGGAAEEVAASSSSSALATKTTTAAAAAAPIPAFANGTGATNSRRLVICYAAAEGCFQVVHGLLNRVMEALGVPTRDPSLSAALGAGSAAAAEKQRREGAPCYGWELSRDPAFFPGRQASVVLYEAEEEQQQEDEEEEEEEVAVGEEGEGDKGGEKEKRKNKKIAYKAPTKVGVFGIVHPDAAAAFGLEGRAVIGALELDLEPFCFDQRYRKLRTHLDMRA